MLLPRLWAQACSLSLREPCFWVFSADRVRNSVRACTHGHVLTHTYNMHLHVCTYMYVCPRAHGHRCRLHRSQPCSHPFRSAPSPEGSPCLLPHPCPCLPHENVAWGNTRVPSPVCSWDGPRHALLHVGLLNAPLLSSAGFSAGLSPLSVG